MPHRTERPGRVTQAGDGDRKKLERTAWLSAVAAVVVALAAAGVSLFLHAPRTSTFVASLAAIEVAVVLAGAFRVARQIGAYSDSCDAQGDELRRHAADLSESAVHAEEARARAEGETRHKARLVALLDAALTSSPVGFGFFDCDLRFLRVNDTLARINGRAPEDHIGASLHDIDPRIAFDVEPMLRQVLATRLPVANVELKGSAPGTSGVSRSWVTSCYPIITADGDLFGVGIAVTDVSEVKALEEQLLQAQKMEAVGRLAGGVAHDFNNLLTVINSYAELILFDPEMAKGHGEVEEIRGAAARAAKLTRQLLAFSRRQALEPRILNPNDVLRGVESLLRRLLDGSVKMTTKLSTETPLIRVDPGQLEQVVMNLAINAADAMQEGGRLEIETMHASVGEQQSRRDLDFLPGEYALIRFADTGHGMDMQTQAQIFEPFFTTKEEGRGTGLGLSTVYGIIKQSGGHVDVESSPGAGSVFTVYLPAVGKAEQAPL